jgi:hypothetical protein
MLTRDACECDVLESSALCHPSAKISPERLFAPTRSVAGARMAPFISATHARRCPAVRKTHSNRRR